MLRFVLVAVLVSFAEALIHFYADAGDRTCFYQDLSIGLIFVGRYRLEILDPDTNLFLPPHDPQNTGVLLDVEETFDSDHRVVHQRGIAAGQFTFSALENGQHRVCLTPRSFVTKSWWQASPPPDVVRELQFKRARILLSFSVSHNDQLIHSSPSTADLSLRIHHLNDKLLDIRREQQFIRTREASFRNQSEQTCDRVVRWTVVQVGALVLSCGYQLWSIRRFFTKQKIS